MSRAIDFMLPIESILTIKKLKAHWNLPDDDKVVEMALQEALKAANIKVNAIKPSDAIKMYRDQIIAVVEKNRAKNPRVFGSVATGEDTVDYDLYLLIDPSEDMSLFDLSAIDRELESLTGVFVFALTPNMLRIESRDSIISESVPI